RLSQFPSSKPSFAFHQDSFKVKEIIIAMFNRIVVIGASAGGVEALKHVVAPLPAGFNAPVFVVLHVPPYRSSALPDILTRVGSLKALHPEDGARIEPGVIYVAPPDQHLLIGDGCV